jgi:NADPH:quinone reductase-like Zn-dependent oxidoreductase
MRATVFLDAVADKETAVISKLLPPSSTAIVYGRLTETHDPIGGKYGVADVIFRDIKIEGFWLSTYVRRAGFIKTLLLTRKVQKLFAEGVFHTDLYGCFGFNEFLTAIDHYAEHKSDGKVILKPSIQ